MLVQAPVSGSVSVHTSAQSRQRGASKPGGSTIGQSTLQTLSPLKLITPSSSSNPKAPIRALPDTFPVSGL